MKNEEIPEDQILTDNKGRKWAPCQYVDNPDVVTVAFKIIPEKDDRWEEEEICPSACAIHLDKNYEYKMLKKLIPKSEFERWAERNTINFSEAKLVAHKILEIIDKACQENDRGYSKEGLKTARQILQDWTGMKA